MKDSRKPTKTLSKFHTTMTEDELTEEILGWFKKKPLFTNLTPIYKATKVAPFYLDIKKKLSEPCLRTKGKHDFADQMYVGSDSFKCLCGITIRSRWIRDFKELRKILLENSTGIDSILILAEKRYG